MPFVEADRMERRIQMLADYDTGAFSVAALCRRYSVSRDTFYAWKARRAEGTTDWFADRSHATRSCPHRLAGPQAEAIVALRRRFPHFGPKKLRAWLRRHDPCGAPCGNWPAASTIGDLLSREGLVAARPKRAAALDGGRTCSPAATANAEWCCDFKGWFRTVEPEVRLRRSRRPALRSADDHRQLEPLPHRGPDLRAHDRRHPSGLRGRLPHVRPARCDPLR